VQTPRLLRASTFQLAILYLLLLGFTLLTLVVIVYWSVSALVERQVTETVVAEIRGLAEQYRDEGLERLIEVVRERSGPGGDHQNVYLLADPLYRPLAGNLAIWPKARERDDGWLEVRLARAGDAKGPPHLIRAQRFDLSGDYHLLVGRDTEARNDLRDELLDAFVWALVPALVLGLVGGVLIGRYSLNRVDAVRRIGEEIIKGDLFRRLPLTGSNDEFDRLSATINEMLEQISTLMSGMRLVTDSLSHDLRSPLTRARSDIEQALRGPAEPEILRKTLENTAAEIETILRTFEALVQIAEAEARVDRVSLVELDLSTLATDLFEVYQPIAEDAGLQLNGDIEAGIVVRGHRQLLAQAIYNLLENAIKYTPAGGRIGMRLARWSERPTLAIGDNGPGIPPAERERVLQRFVRLDQSRGSAGSGLGLSLVAAVAKMHGARMELADNEPGLLVRVSFPPPQRNLLRTFVTPRLTERAHQ
jgi:signal transduction histidine kinase